MPLAFKIWLDDVELSELPGYHVGRLHASREDRSILKKLIAVCVSIQRNGYINWWKSVQLRIVCPLQSTTRSFLNCSATLEAYYDGSRCAIIIARQGGWFKKWNKSFAPQFFFFNEVFRNISNWLTQMFSLEPSQPKMRVHLEALDHRPNIVCASRLRVAQNIPFLNVGLIRSVIEPRSYYLTVW